MIDNLYYLQNGYSGNQILWWKEGRRGYTTDIELAHVFTYLEAKAQHESRSTDIPWRKDYIDSKIKRTVNSEHISLKDKDAQ